MVMAKLAVAVLLTASVTFTTKLDVPDEVGVPLIVPFEASVRPTGSVPL